MRILVFLVLLAVANVTVGQTVTDAIRVANYQRTLTARSAAMAGAGAAISTDIGGININPATVGLFTAPQANLSLGLDLSGSNTTHYGNSTIGSRNVLQIGSAGAVLVNQATSPNQKVKFLNFSVSSNKLADFNSVWRAEGINADNSLIDVFFEDLRRSGIQPSEANQIQDAFPFTTAAPWETFVIDTFLGDFINVIPFGENLQSRLLDEAGSLRETDLNLGINLNHKLFVGASIGLQNYNYRSLTEHEERMDETDTTSALSDFFYTEELEISGSGINIKIGGLYKPVDYVSVGFFWHSSTRLNMEETYNTEMISNYKSGEVLSYQSPIGIFEYNVRNPMRYGLNLGVRLKKYAIWNTDLEFVHHNRTKFRSNIRGGSDFELLNNDINRSLNTGIQIRSGIEFKLKQHFLRLGGFYQSSPSNSPLVQVAQNQGFTFGYGITFKKYAFDLAISSQNSSQVFYLYDNDKVESAGLSPLKLTENRLASIGVLAGLSFRL